MFGGTRQDPSLSILCYFYCVLIVCCIAERCTRSLYSHVYSALWYRSRCYLAFFDRRTWLGAATMCVHRRGNLASYRNVDTTSVPIVRANFIPHSCVWVGLVKHFLYWTTTKSQFVKMTPSLQSIITGCAVASALSLL